MPERGRPTDYSAIYVLADPRDCRIRYVGKSVSPSKRYSAHCSRHRTRWHPLDAWVDDLRSVGLKPKMRVILRTRDWENEERRLIGLCRETGRRLINIEDGGQVAKTSQKRMSRAFITYRKVMATLSREITRAEKTGRVDRVASLGGKIKKIRESVRSIEQKGPDRLEAFYLAVHERFG